MLVYLSNESSTITEVYFDDLEIELNEHPVIQTNAYYPFGLEFAGGYQRITAKRNDYLYNGFELQKSLDWGVYDYLTRYYDPAIGRFLQVDPAADLMRRHSPYNYAFDNPIRFIDPDGMMPHEINVDPPEWLKSIGEGFKQLGQEFAKLGEDIGGAAVEVWDGLGEAIDNAPKESTTEQAVGDGVDIQGETAGVDSEFVPTADGNADNVVMEKEFLDGMTAGAKALKVGPADDIGVSAQKVASAVSKGSSAVKSGEKVFSGGTETAPDTVDTGRGTIQYNGDGTKTIFSQKTNGVDTFNVEVRTEKIDLK